MVVSPHELNAHLRTHIVAPLTTGSFRYPFRVPCTFQGKAGHIVLDQARAGDRERFVKHLGMLSSPALEQAPLRFFGRWSPHRAGGTDTGAVIEGEA